MRFDTTLVKADKEQRRKVADIIEQSCAGFAKYKTKEKRDQGYAFLIDELSVDYLEPYGIEWPHGLGWFGECWDNAQTRNCVDILSILGTSDEEESARSESVTEQALARIAVALERIADALAAPKQTP
jgi:hypothetical protein